MADDSRLGRITEKLRAAMILRNDNHSDNSVFIVVGTNVQAGITNGVDNGAIINIPCVDLITLVQSLDVMLAARKRKTGDG